MKSPSQNSKSRSAGFIISLEFLLVLALVIFPLMIGFFMLGKKVVTLYLNQLMMIEQPLSRPVIWDSSGTAKPVGPVIGYDSFETPLVLYRDHTGIFPVVATEEFIPGVLLGVRPNRFTTISRVYYDGPNCVGTPYVKAAAASISAWPNVGFISQTQGINYAMGAGNVLYREATLGTTGANQLIGSVWVSRDVGDDSPAGPGSTACMNITGGPITLVTLDDTGTTPIVTGTTTVNHNFSTGDFVLIAGAGNATYDGVWQLGLTVSNTTTFTFTGPGGVGASAGGTVTLLTTIPNLVATTLVADLDSGANFTRPYRVAFPTAIPITALPGGSGG